MVAFSISEEYLLDSELSGILPMVSARVGGYAQPWKGRMETEINGDCSKHSGYIEQSLILKRKRWVYIKVIGQHSNSNGIIQTLVARLLARQSIISFHSLTNMTKFSCEYMNCKKKTNHCILFLQCGVIDTVCMVAFETLAA